MSSFIFVNDKIHSQRNRYHTPSTFRAQRRLLFTNPTPLSTPAVAATGNPPPPGVSPPRIPPIRQDERELAVPSCVHGSNVRSEFLNAALEYEQRLALDKRACRTSCIPDLVLVTSWLVHGLTVCASLNLTSLHIVVHIDHKNT